jgi:hypothetical protein
MPLFRLQSTLRLGQVRLAVAALAIGLPVLFVATIPTPTAAVVRIRDDRGGIIGAYWSRFSALRDMGEKIIIDGTCSSACTLVLGIVPHDRICVTRRALLGFHAAWRPDFPGSKTINEPATRTLMSFYPLPIRRWIEDHGGLGTDMMYLSGRELMAMYRECR